MTAAYVLDEVFTIIGEVCYRWAAIEEHVAGICLHAAVCAAPPVETEAVWEVLWCTLSNMGLRERVRTAKAMVHLAGGSALSLRHEKLFDLIDNDLRIERNRYVHERWGTDGSRIIRHAAGSSIRKPQSGIRTLEQGSETHYHSIAEVRAFLDRLESAYHSLTDLDNELCSIASR